MYTYCKGIVKLQWSTVTYVFEYDGRLVNSVARN